LHTIFKNLHLHKPIDIIFNRIGTDMSRA
jgi:hypothetical protein